VQSYSRYISVIIFILLFFSFGPAFAEGPKVKYVVTGENVFALKGNLDAVQEFYKAVSEKDMLTIEKMLRNRSLMQLLPGSTFWKTKDVRSVNMVLGYSKIQDNFVIVIGLGEDCKPVRWD
jgi:hypothetical protein